MIGHGRHTHKDCFPLVEPSGWWWWQPMKVGLQVCVRNGLTLSRFSFQCPSDFNFFFLSFFSELTSFLTPASLPREPPFDPLRSSLPVEPLLVEPPAEPHRVEPHPVEPFRSSPSGRALQVEPFRSSPSPPVEPLPVEPLSGRVTQCPNCLGLVLGLQDIVSIASFVVCVHSIANRANNSTSCSDNALHKACERACPAGTQHVHSREIHQMKPSLAVPTLWTPSSCVCRSQRTWWARVRCGSMQPSLGTSAPGCTHEAKIRWWWCFVWAYLSCQNTTCPHERVPRWLPTVTQWLACLPEHEIQRPSLKCTRLGQQWELTPRTLHRSRAFSRLRNCSEGAQPWWTTPGSKTRQGGRGWSSRWSSRTDQRDWCSQLILSSSACLPVTRNNGFHFSRLHITNHERRSVPMAATTNAVQLDSPTLQLYDCKLSAGSPNRDMVGSMPDLPTNASWTVACQTPDTNLARLQPGYSDKHQTAAKFTSTKRIWER